MSYSSDNKIFCSDFEKAFFGCPMACPPAMFFLNTLLDISAVQQRCFVDIATAMTLTTMETALRSFQGAQALIPINTAETTGIHNRKGYKS